MSKSIAETGARIAQWIQNEVTMKENMTFTERLEQMRDMNAGLAQESFDRLEAIHDLRAALQVVLDCADYTHLACKPTQPVAAVLPLSAIKQARGVLGRTKHHRNP